MDEWSEKENVSFVEFMENLINGTILHNPLRRMSENEVHNMIRKFHYDTLIAIYYNKEPPSYFTDQECKDLYYLLKTIKYYCINIDTINQILLINEYDVSLVTNFVIELYGLPPGL